MIKSWKSKLFVAAVSTVRELHNMIKACRSSYSFTAVSAVRELQNMIEAKYSTQRTMICRHMTKKVLTHSNGGFQVEGVWGGFCLDANNIFILGSL